MKTDLNFTLSKDAFKLYKVLELRQDECYWSPNRVAYEAHELGLRLSSQEIVWISDNLP